MRRHAKKIWWLAAGALVAVLMAMPVLVQAAKAQPINPSLISQNYQVFAFNDLGMHCYDNDFSVFSLLPPFNVVHGQVIQKGLKPKLLTGAQVKLTYAALADPSGSINTTSTTTVGGIPKTNFWQYLALLFGVSQPPDTGILGAKMPGPLNTPQALSYDSAYKWFSATGIPLTNIDDQGNINSFSMMKIRAFDQKSGAFRSSLNIVVPASSEMNCASCHETAAKADYITTFSDASPPPRIGPDGANFIQETDFSMNDNGIIRVRENVLILHDAMGSYHGQNAAYPGFIDAAYPGFNSLWEVYQSGQPILCAKCHYSKALDLTGTGPDALQAPHLFLSRAMHKHHGTSWPMMDTTYVIPIPGAYASPATPSECYYCHPGNDTQCLRSVMAVQGMACQNCHGDLLAIAGFTSQLATDGYVDSYLASTPWNVDAPVVTLKSGPHQDQQRQPWQDMPKCQSCHTGDALKHQGDSIVGQMAYDPNDDAATPIMADNPRFAEKPDTLYRFSQTHGGMACESCHGSPHAEWPAKIASVNDNITSTQIQGHVGEIAECGACHLNGLKPSLGGPHGLHNVNDPGWLSLHGTPYRQNQTSCQACHGPDLKGTVLSRAKADRNLRQSSLTGDGKKITITKGTTVDCYACHNVIR